MSFPQYSEYKDSGVPWLGKVPSNWNVGCLKHLLRIRGGQDYKAVESEVSTEFPVIGSGGPFAYATDYLYDGESVLLGRKGTVDKPLYVKGKFWTVDTMFYTEVMPGCNGRYAYYLATTIPFALYSTNTALPSMSQFDLANHVVPLPAFEEQSQIARVLDHETAKIDALIREQERLIELLQEKRQAVISHSVTKGVDPHVQMKDSGVEWLGEVPEHWDVTRLKFATSLIVDCPHETPNYDPDGEFLVIRTADLHEGVLNPSHMFRLQKDDFIHRTRRAALMEYDIVYGREGERWGHAALVPEDNLYCLGQRMMQFRSNDDFDSQFLMYQLNSEFVYRQGDLDTVGATAPHVNVSTIKNYLLTRPPKEEQRLIGTYLNGVLGRYDELIDAAYGSTRILNERRSALVSAAVTGKIDVRSWQPAEDESAFDDDVRQAGLEVAV